jgi:membrane associated rhomboid family serine protease
MNKKAQFFPVKDDNPTSRFPAVNWALIGLNVVVFVISLTNFEQIIQKFGFVPASFSILTMFTSMFLHGGIAHILGNMWFLFIFGDNVEDRLGHFKYLIFYLASGLVASLSHYLLNIGSAVPAVGASGAISGVLGAYLIFFPKAQVYVTGSFGAGKVSAKLMLLFWFGFQLVSGTLSLFGDQSGIAFFAHIGGFVFGMLGALAFKALSKKN